MSKHNLFWMFIIICNSHAMHFTAENATHHTIRAYYKLELWGASAKNKTPHRIKILRENISYVMSNDIYNVQQDNSLLPPPGNLFFLGVHNIPKNNFLLFAITLLDNDNHVINQTCTRFDYDVIKFMVHIDKYSIITIPTSSIEKYIFNKTILDMKVDH